MANSKLTNFKDLKVEYPERYKVINEDLTEETKTIRFLPGITYQEGTPETAENFNNIQRNSIYEVAGNRIIEGQNEIYDITIEGSQEFIFTDLKLCLVPNETNTKKGPLLRFNGNTYTIKNAQDTVNIGSIASKEKIFLNLNFTQKTAEIIGVLTGGSHRTIKQLDTDYRANTGIPYDPEIEYIQDTGTKKVGYCYKDRNQEGIFKCKENSTTTTNLSNIFDKFDNNELLNRLQNLYQNIYKKVIWTGQANVGNSFSLSQKVSDFDFLYCVFLSRSGGRKSSNLLPAIGIWNIVFRNETGFSSVDFELTDTNFIFKSIIDNAGNLTSTIFDIEIVGIKLI